MYRLVNFKENNKLLGAILYNTTSSILLSYESCRVIYPKAAKHVKQILKKNYGLSDRSYNFFDFVVHIFPFIYLLKTFSTEFDSLYIHSKFSFIYYNLSISNERFR